MSIVVHIAGPDKDRAVHQAERWDKLRRVHGRRWKAQSYQPLNHRHLCAAEAALLSQQPDSCPSLSHPSPSFVLPGGEQRCWGAGEATRRIAASGTTETLGPADCLQMPFVKILNGLRLPGGGRRSTVGSWCATDAGWPVIDSGYWSEVLASGVRQIFFLGVKDSPVAALRQAGSVHALHHRSANMLCVLPHRRAPIVRHEKTQALCHADFHTHRTIPAALSVSCCHQRVWHMRGQDL